MSSSRSEMQLFAVLAADGHVSMSRLVEAVYEGESESTPGEAALRWHIHQLMKAPRASRD